MGGVMTVVLATSNRGKLEEMRSLLATLPIEIVGVLDVVPSFVAPPEDGETFEANAFIKARAAADATQLVAVADDSGLEVDALAGRPGVRSARFAHEGATDAENNAALLSALSDIEDADRTARFRCVLALVDPFSSLDQPLYADGRCEGVIARSPRGESGFGYDPLFVVSSVGRTFAELVGQEKNEISHRGQAVRTLRPQIEALVKARLEQARRVMEAARR
jgi:XTP/dITP diphosphohydrolase